MRPTELIEAGVGVWVRPRLEVRLVCLAAGVIMVGFFGVLGSIEAFVL